MAYFSKEREETVHRTQARYCQQGKREALREKGAPAGETQRKGVREMQKTAHKRQGVLKVIIQ